MTTIVSILVAAIVIGVLAFVHELGHFWVAKKFGFGILEFAIGMGPVLWKKEKDGVQYSLRAFPIGGLCRFEGEDENSNSATAFNKQAVWKRMLVAAAGPFMNLLFAVVFATVTLAAYGDYMPEIVDFASASPAAEAGMQKGDVLLRVGNTKLEYYTDATDAIMAADSESCTVIVDRGGEKVELTLHAIYSEAEGRNMLGVTIQPVRYHFPIFTCIGNSFHYIGELVNTMVGFFGNLFKGEVHDGDLGGPVMIVDVIGQAVRLGFETVLRLTVLLSVNLAIVNLLPIPGLDGGRLVFMLIEAVRGKPMDPDKEGMIHLIGFALLMALVVFLTYKDVVRLLR
ncbi:MAG: M50 family metallopeptidase [Eubacteriales bacterium]|nr:M50 family metallopeptidase [Eubacteriales bacterium]